jgi:hypothetical protein
MNLRPATACLLLPLLPLAPRAAEPPAAAEATNFEVTRTQVEALLRGRDAPPLLPADLVNPFSRPDERALDGSAPAAVDPAKRAAATDRELLERFGPGIQVRGFVETAGHPAIIINRKPFEVGDTLALTQGGTKIEVRIKRITNEDFTISYRDAELTLRLPR